MKILLHALLSYLTATALPFTPFALAHPGPLPTSIDYNGSVNTSQNHIDGTLMKRAPGDIIEACQDPLDATLVFILIAAIQIDIQWIKEDKPVRGNEVDRVPCGPL